MITTNRIFFDTEFLEDGRTIQLISIGLVKENGEEYYAETPAARRLCFNDDWLMDNVLPHLETTILRPKEKDYESVIKGKYQIANEIVEFCGPNPEFWAYYADYDWVVLCQLYGRMIDLPKTWPMYCKDFKQTVDEFNSVGALFEPPYSVELDKIDPEEEHNAITDARWLKFQYLKF